MTPNYLAQDADINEKIAALEGLLNDVFGPDQIVIRSTKLEILHLLGSSDVKKWYFTMPPIAEKVLWKNGWNPSCWNWGI